MKISTINELSSAATNARWFNQLGTYPESVDFFVIHSISPEPSVDCKWDWLPSTSDQVDPIHVPSLKQIAMETGCETLLADTSREIYKHTLHSLRSVPEQVPALLVGSSNVTPAARGAALFAFRMATAEIILGRHSLWCVAVSIYAQGFWPCGLHDNGQLVIF